MSPSYPPCPISSRITASRHPIETWIDPMSKNRRQTARKPATKFAHLQKKMQRQKTQVKRPRAK